MGTDIGGSIRLPGTWLGLTTLKPSAGRVPLDTPYLGRAAGPLARSARDAALLLSVISRPDVRDWTSLPPEDLGTVLPPEPRDVRGLRVGLHLDAGCGLAVEPEVRQAVEAAAAVFAEGGAEVETLSPFMTPRMLHDLDEFWRVRSLADFQALSPEARERVLPFIQRWVLAVREVDGTTVLRDYASIMALQQATLGGHQPYDLVLSPVAPVTAFPADWPMPWGEEARGMVAHRLHRALQHVGTAGSVGQLRVHARWPHHRVAGVGQALRRRRCALRRRLVRGAPPRRGESGVALPEMSDIGGSHG